MHWKIYRFTGGIQSTLPILLNLIVYGFKFKFFFESENLVRFVVFSVAHSTQQITPNKCVRGQLTEFHIEISNSVETKADVKQNIPLFVLIWWSRCDTLMEVWESPKIQASEHVGHRAYRK